MIVENEEKKKDSHKYLVSYWSSYMKCVYNDIVVWEDGITEENIRKYQDDYNHTSAYCHNIIAITKLDE